MSDFRSNPNCFKEAVCIEAQRIYDSCSDKDCLEDLEVIFTDGNTKQIIENATYVKSKSVEVINAFFAIEPVPFNKGFFSIDLTYTCNVVLEAYTTPTLPPQTCSGTTSFTKKVILYGSEGNAKIFSSDDEVDTTSLIYTSSQSLPRCTVQVVEPMVLDTKLVTKYPFHCAGNAAEPFNGNDEQSLGTNGMRKRVYVTIGIFSIIQLQRPVPILIPAYDYCIPHKDCSTTSDSPCELFEKIKFPTNEFFPPALEDVDDESECETPTI